MSMIQLWHSLSLLLTTLNIINGVHQLATRVLTNYNPIYSLRVPTISSQRIIIAKEKFSIKEYIQFEYYHITSKIWKWMFHDEYEFKKTLDLKK